MSGSAGGNRIPRAAVEKTVQEYIQKILSKFPSFRGAKISGSYNTSAKSDFGDIDLIVQLDSEDKKNIKAELAKYVSSLPDDVIVPFKSDKYKGKKFLNTGEIITILYPITGIPDNFVQIDNIVSISDKEAEFKKEFLDYPAEIQGLILGLAKVACLEEDPQDIFARMGIKNIPTLEPNQEYEFNLSSSGLTLRIVTLDNFKETDRTDVWKTSDWSNIKKLFANYKIDGTFEELLNDISSKLKNIRSKNRVRGIFNSMVSIKSGEVGTAKGDNKQKSLDKVNTTLTETNLGRYLASLILEAEDQPTVALFPGAFKPPHKGHVDVVNKLLKAADQVVVLISPKTREGITADESVAIWNLYKDKGLFDGSVEIKISSSPTPVRETYEVVENNPDSEFLVAFGKGEIDRYKNIEKFPNVKVFDAGEIEGVSATNLRMALAQKNEEEIAKSLPEKVSVDEFLQALNIQPEEKPEEQPPAEIPPAETTPPKGEQPLQESPPINFEDESPYQDYVEQNRRKIEQASAVFNLPIPDMEYAFNSGGEVVLNDDMWKEMENTKSYNTKTLSDAISHALKIGIDPKPYIDAIKKQDDIPLPLVLQYAQGKYYLVGGEVILSIYRSLGVIPTVLLATLNLQTKTLPNPMNENLIREYSVGLINKLIQKFKQEDPELTDDEIKKVIKRFDQIKDNVDEKDILKYTWDNLVDTAASIEPKRIKAGKINDGEVDNADLVYNQNGLRVYKAGDKKSCIKYGTGYTFCISARGTRNYYTQYRAGNEEISPSLAYFVFDDNRPSGKDENGKYLDNTHLLVVMAEEGDYGGYLITEADNTITDWYDTLEEASSKYPQLRRLENVLEYEPPADDDIDIKIGKLEQEKDEALGNYGVNMTDPLFNNFPYISKDRALALLKGDAILVELTYQYPSSRSFTQVSVSFSNEEEVKRFIIGNSTNAGNAEISYKILPITDKIKKFLLGIIEISNQYDKQIAKAKLQSLNEGLNTDNDKKLLKKFIGFAIKELGIQKPPTSLTLSRDNNMAKSMRSFGSFNPNNDKIWLYVKNRNMADLLRTLAHELVHRKQAEDGRIDYNSGKTGSEIENEANAMAGVLLRKFGKQNEEIYQ